MGGFLNGIGATINLHTAKPLDLDGFRSVVSAKGNYESSNEEITPATVFIEGSNIRVRRALRCGLPADVLIDRRQWSELFRRR